MNYHTIIQAERRSGGRATAISNRASIPDGVDAEGMPKTKAGPEQLHSMGTGYSGDNANVIYCAEWDLQKPYVTVLKGDHATRSLDFAGWPTVTKEQFEQANDPDVVDLDGTFTKEQLEEILAEEFPEP